LVDTSALHSLHFVIAMVTAPFVKYCRPRLQGRLLLKLKKPYHLASNTAQLSQPETYFLGGSPQVGK